MTEWIRNWLLGVSCTAMVMAIAEAITPEGGMRHICRLAGGLMMLLAAVSPVLSLNETMWEWTVAEYQMAAENYEETLSEQNNLLYQSIIEENTAAYILDKARENGISCQVKVVLSVDEKGNPYPKEVYLSGDWTDERKSILSSVLKTELGISSELQYFERTTE